MYCNFYKEEGMWFIDLPEFIESGLGSKSNLLMIDGADILLDLFLGNKPNQSNDGSKITLRLDSKKIEEFDCKIDLLDFGKDQNKLDLYNHAPVDRGAYYFADKLFGKRIDLKIWLCPVTEYVFKGTYPNEIYIKREL